MKRGFTLIEMVVVLVVLGVLAHLAVRELGRGRDARLTDAADRMLTEIRGAVWTQDGGGEPAGFLADMGRLPRSLDELWEIPSDSRRFCVTNAASGVYVPTGWNGPYLRLPPGKSALYDPWGNDICATTNAQGFVTNVFHLGATGQLRTRSRDFPIVPAAGEKSSLVVALAAGGVESVAVEWFGPDGFGGVTNGSGVVTVATPCKFEGLAPGRRILSISGAGMRIVNLKPGDNLMELDIAE